MPKFDVCTSSKTLAGIQISKFELTYKKQRERCMFLWAMYDLTLLKFSKFFMAILWTKVMLSCQLLEFVDQI